MQKLTARQAQILELIRDYLAHSGMPPTRVEIARELGFRSPNAAEDHLKALAKKGAITLTPGTSRGIRLANIWENGYYLPIVGKVAAGNPILCEEHIEDQVNIGSTVFRPRADYLLRVQGMSMRDAGILNDDLLAVHKTKDVTSGQIVVARIDDEVTVKRFRRHGRYIHLAPENPEFSIIEVDLKQDTFDIEGVGVGVVRNGGSL